MIINRQPNDIGTPKQSSYLQSFFSFIAKKLSNFVADNPVAVITILFFTWLLGHAWMGFWHDGMLYLGQALHRVSPDHYPGDPFFMYGSQDDYTVFTSIYAWFIKHIGIASAGITLMLIAHIAWVASIFWLYSAALGRRTAAVFAFFTLLLLPNTYGGFRIFSYGEVFLTARSWAEPLILVSIALLLKQRAGLALLPIFCAFILHPLVAICGFLVWYIHFLMFLSSRRVRRSVIILSIIACSVLLLLAYENISPFGKLIRIYSPIWYGFVIGFNRQVLLSYWQTQDWTLLTSTTALYVIYRVHFSKSSLRDLLDSLFIASLFGLSLSYLLGDTLHLVFGLSIQLWRTTWTFRLIAPAVVLAEIWKNRDILPKHVLWAAILATLGNLIQTDYTGAIFVAASLALLLFKNNPVGAPLGKYITLGLILAVGVELINRDLLDSIYVHTQFLAVRYTTLYPHLIGVLLGLSILIAASLLKKRSIAWLLIAVFSFGAATTWDRRPDLEIFFENAPNHNPFSQYMAADDTVYWNAFRPMTWIAFNQSSYINGMTAAPILFNENYAYEFIARYNNIQEKYLASKVTCTKKLFGTGNCADSADTINPGLCQIDDRMRWIVSDYKSDLPMVAHWNFSLIGLPHGVYLYDCHEWLKLPPTTPHLPAPKDKQ